MDTSLAISYLSILVGILAVIAWLIVRQVIKSRNQEKVLSDLQPKLQKEKGSAAEHYELGSIYLKKKLYVAAINELKKALKASDGKIPEAYNAMGYAYFAQEQYDLAIKNYREAIALQPEYVTALNNLAHAFEKKKLIPQALEAYEQSLVIDPDNKTAQNRLESLRKRI